MDLDTSTQLLARARQTGNGPALAEVLLRHADVLLHAGRLAESAAAVDEAAALHRARGAIRDEARCLRLAATLQRLQGRLQDAQRHAQGALDLSGGHAADACAAHAELGEIALARHDTPAALAAFSAALDSVAPAPASWWRARAKAHALAGGFEAAAADLETAVGLCQAAGETHEGLRTMVEAATAWQQARHWARAQTWLAAATPLAMAAGDEEALAGLALLSATGALAQGDAVAARAFASAARSHALAARAAAPYIGAAVALSRIDEQGGNGTGAYAALATGWATLGDLLGTALARSTFEPLLRGLRDRLGTAPFDAARRAYETGRLTASTTAAGEKGPPSAAAADAASD